jgi:hypothetical protein
MEVAVLCQDLSISRVFATALQSKPAALSSTQDIDWPLNILLPQDTKTVTMPSTMFGKTQQILAFLMKDLHTLEQVEVVGSPLVLACYSPKTTKLGRLSSNSCRYPKSMMFTSPNLVRISLT